MSEVSKNYITFSRYMEKINQDYIFETNTNNARAFVNKINDLIDEVNRLKKILQKSGIKC